MRKPEKLSEVYPLVAIVGQTATGKSRLAIQLAEEFKGEIITADSWTVRKYLDIGTAKPSASERGRVQHHLLDIVAPCQDFNAAQFKQLALKKLDEIHARQSVPFLVGGTGLYIDSVLFDYSFSPPADLKIRKRYNSMTLQELLSEAERNNLDTNSIDTRNKRRVIRLLETNGAQPEKKNLRPNTLVIGISADKPTLDDRIEQRIRAMIEQGLAEEVEQLADTYGWECEGLKGIGYREWRAYFESRASLEDTIQSVIRSTRQLAKRQKTWFRANKSIRWCTTQAEARQEMYTFLQNQ